MENVEAVDVQKFEQRMKEEVRKWMEQRDRNNKSWEMSINSFLQKSN